MNLKAMADELELEEHEYIELIHLFIETSATDVEILKSALANGDAENAANAAHSIKGAAGNLRFNDLYETAKKMEMAARDGNLEHVSGDFVILIKELTSIETLTEGRF
jgi:HPt (histidine-containing phosphotransfer) domain-containing protein